MKNRFFISILFFLSASYISAQDFHMTQYDTDPLALNPAMTGERLTDAKGVRFNANYRDQRANYTSGTGSYKSFAQGLDVNLKNKFSRVAVGEHFSNNTSVNKAFRVNEFMLSGAYKLIADDEDSSQALSFGLQLGLLTHNFDTPQLSYGNQYDPNADNSYNQNITSGEATSRTKSAQFSSNLGVYYRIHLLKKRLTAYAGASLFNITNRYETVLGQKGKVPLKFAIHGGALYKFNDEITLQPQVMFMSQNRAHELVLGTLVMYNMGAANQLISGISWRTRNALIFQFGFKMRNNTFRFSYCLVNSYLAPYENKGLEISFIHIAM